MLNSPSYVTVFNKVIYFLLLCTINWFMRYPPFQAENSIRYDAAGKKIPAHFGFFSSYLALVANIIPAHNRRSPRIISSNYLLGTLI